MFFFLNEEDDWCNVVITYSSFATADPGMAPSYLQCPNKSSNKLSTYSIIW